MRSGFLRVIVIGGIALTGVVLVGAKGKPSSPARTVVASIEPRVAPEFGAASRLNATVLTAPRAIRTPGPQEAGERTAKTVNHVPLGRSTIVVATDPETGALTMPERSRGSALTIAELQALAHREAEGLVTVRNADGSETLNHEGRFAEHSVIRVGPDGKLLFRCVQGDHGVGLALDKSGIVRSSNEGE